MQNVYTVGQVNSYIKNMFDNDFMLKYVYPEYNGSVYELYFYAGALLNTFLKWEELGKSESVDEIVDIVISLIKRNNLSLT